MSRMQYQSEIEVAKNALIDLQERGEAAIGGSWREFRKDHYTPEQIAECDFRVAIIGELIKARLEKGISQKKLEELSGVKQPIIARIEKGNVSPQISTLLKVLLPLGKTLYIGDLPTING